MPRYEGIINRYRAFLPIAKDDAVITLYEGNTPLHESHNLRNAINPELKRSEEHTSELQSHHDLVCRLLLEKKKIYHISPHDSSLL